MDTFIQRCRNLKYISLCWYNVVPSFRTYCASKCQTKQQIENQQTHNSSASKKPAIDVTIQRIEKLALVGFDYEQSKRVLEEAIAFTERLRNVHISETVRPMYATLENEHIRLRQDEVQQTASRREILKNATVLEEEYFVAPLKNNS